jgi:nitrite reductase/ring-hydroxylating ferredoxin subunit
MSTRVALPEANIPPPGQRRLWRHGEKLIVLFHVEGRLYAIDDTCPHAGASLAAGKLEGRTLQCPAHGLKFDLTSGCMRTGSGLGMSLTTYPEECAHGRATITLPEATNSESAP